MRRRVFRQITAAVAPIAGAPAVGALGWTNVLPSTALQIEFVAFCAPWFLIWIFVGFWAYYDSKSRNMNSVLWFLLVFFLGLIGLIAYFVVRGSHPVGGAPAAYPPYGAPQPYYPGAAQPPATPPGAYYPPPGQPPAAPPAGPPVPPQAPATPSPAAALSFCRNCGNRLPPGAKFCATCGASV